MPQLNFHIMTMMLEHERRMGLIEGRLGPLILGRAGNRAWGPLGHDVILQPAWWNRPNAVRAPTRAVKTVFFQRESPAIA